MAVIKVLKLCYENRDFWLNREKHIVALGFARPRALRALGLACLSHSRALRALEWLSPLSLGPLGNTAAGACQRPDDLLLNIVRYLLFRTTNCLFAVKCQLKSFDSRIKCGVKKSKLSNLVLVFLVLSDFSSFRFFTVEQTLILVRCYRQ